MTIKVGDVTKTITMHTLDSKTLAGIFQPTDLTALMDAMDKASTASLIFGSKKPVSVSLNGSTRVLNAFRTCATVHEFANLGGSAGAKASPF